MIARVGGGRAASANRRADDFLTEESSPSMTERGEPALKYLLDGSPRGDVHAAV